MRAQRQAENNSRGGGGWSLKHTDSRAAAVGAMAGALGAANTLDLTAMLGQSRRPSR
jgi:hypothetical protein